MCRLCLSGIHPNVRLETLLPHAMYIGCQMCVRNAQVKIVFLMLPILKTIIFLIQVFFIHTVVVTECCKYTKNASNHDDRALIDLHLHTSPSHFPLHVA